MYGKKEGKTKAKMGVESICILGYREREKYGSIQSIDHPKQRY
jgi:hypothetical protein